MSKYTTELRFVCETYAGYNESQDRLKVDEIIERARPKLFDFDYPIFDPAYKKVLETKIIKHYYLREIGAETVGVFKLFLDRTLNEIMPYYNQMYESALLKYNPLYDVDYIREHEGNKDVAEDKKNDHTNTETLNVHTAKTGTDTTVIDGENWRLFHDTPQGSIANLDNESYLTSAEKDTIDRTDTITYNSDIGETGTRKNDGKIKEDNLINTTDKYVTHIYGKSAYKSYPSLIKEYRETLINIDLLIINELNDCFMLLY